MNQFYRNDKNYQQKLFELQQRLEEITVFSWLTVKYFGADDRLAPERSDVTMYSK